MICPKAPARLETECYGRHAMIILKEVFKRSMLRWPIDQSLYCRRRFCDGFTRLYTDAHI